MNAIKIPYLPISSFDEDVVCEKFEEESLEKTVDKTSNFSAEKHSSIDVLFLLHGMGMEKYADIFRNENVPLKTFLMLTDADLLELGITDSKDREVIVKNLEHQQIRKNEFIVSENPADDYSIALNAYNQLLLLQNYCAYVELKMRKEKYTDYKVSCKNSACDYLKAFIDSAIVQSKRLSNFLFVGSHHNHLIGKLLLMYNLSLPKHLQDKLKINKRCYSSVIFKTVAAVGVSSVIILTGKFMFHRRFS